MIVVVDESGMLNCQRLEIKTCGILKGCKREGSEDESGRNNVLLTLCLLSC